MNTQKRLNYVDMVKGIAVIWMLLRLGLPLVLRQPLVCVLDLFFGLCIIRVQ